MFGADQGYGEARKSQEVCSGSHSKLPEILLTAWCLRQDVTKQTFAPCWIWRYRSRTVVWFSTTWAIDLTCTRRTVKSFICYLSSQVRSHWAEEADAIRRIDRKGSLEGLANHLGRRARTADKRIRGIARDSSRITKFSIANWNKL